jgi:MFS family permease
MLIRLGHVMLAGPELWQSASDCGLQSELSDHRRLGDYQGVWSLGYQAGPVIFPGLYTFLALTCGGPGWAVIAVLAVIAAVVAHPAAHGTPAMPRACWRIGADLVGPAPRRCERRSSPRAAFGFA